MYTNDYMYAVDRSDEYLAHYGVKGMKWGVRKAIESGSERRLDRAYRKASRKLAKLERQANNGKKYAKRAARLGAGAAAAGGLAVAGTEGAANLVKGAGEGVANVSRFVGRGVHNVGDAMVKAGIRGGGRVRNLGTAMKDLGDQSVRGNQYVKAVQDATRDIKAWGKGRHDLATAAKNIGGKYGQAEAGQKLADTLNKHGMGSVSNNTLARAGAAALGAGLAGAAGYNAYRAATTKRAGRKAAEFRSEMNKAFQGTKYANGGNGGQKKRRRR